MKIENIIHSRLPWFQALDDARQGVLKNMGFNLGFNGLEVPGVFEGDGSRRLGSGCVSAQELGMGEAGWLSRSAAPRADSHGDLAVKKGEA